VIHEDHFGGYARKSKPLFDFMNRLFFETGIPTDFVYTGKLFFSVDRMAAGKIFPAGSRILVLHTGGLQGNQSLSPGLLQF
jgi:1-aminocyclopropane-1-carboxylate deaminase